MLITRNKPFIIKCLKAKLPQLFQVLKITELRDSWQILNTQHTSVKMKLQWKSQWSVKSEAQEYIHKSWCPNPTMSGKKSASMFFCCKMCCVYFKQICWYWNITLKTLNGAKVSITIMLSRIILELQCHLFAAYFTWVKDLFCSKST